jgi:hypothetical protein
VKSARNDADGRGVMLTLTPKGQVLHRKVFADAVARNERLLSPLSTEQRRQLMEMLSALTVSARRVLDDERRAAAGEHVEGDEAAPPATPAIPVGKGGAPGIDLAEARYLASRLHDLLGGSG